MDHHHRHELQGCDCSAVDGSRRRDDPDDQPVGHLSAEATTTESDEFQGQRITADHAEYDGARALSNGAIDRRLRLIARCIGSADVVAAVRFARDRDLEIAIRGGGHNVAGTAVCDDGFVIDLSAMRAVRVDPKDCRMSNSSVPGRRSDGVFGSPISD